MRRYCIPIPKALEAVLSSMNLGFYRILAKTLKACSGMPRGTSVNLLILFLEVYIILSYCFMLKTQNCF